MAASRVPPTSEKFHCTITDGLGTLRSATNRDYPHKFMLTARARIPPASRHSKFFSPCLNMLEQLQFPGCRWTLHFESCRANDRCLHTASVFQHFPTARSSSYAAARRSLGLQGGWLYISLPMYVRKIRLHCLKICEWRKLGKVHRRGIKRR